MCPAIPDTNQPVRSQYAAIPTMRVYVSGKL
ncbi:unnamed protein product [Ectocarpus sp. CCAP 1310/34]|nr:unnamed protein product [Ectocarpus sp. CCAP 1310/34]